MRYLALLTVAGLTLAAPVPVQAVSLYFSEDGLAGKVIFNRDDDNLVVTLVNSSLADVLVPSQILTAVFFDLADSALLTPLSAIVAPGSEVVFAGDPPEGWPSGWPPTNVGGEWAYQVGLSGGPWDIPGDADQGISSSGLDPFGPKDLFPGVNLSGPESPGGMEYGLISAGDDPSTGNAQVTGENPHPFVKFAVVFTLGGLPEDFDLSTGVSNVWLQYGTDLEEGPSYEAVPEPVTMAGLLLAVGALGAYMRRRRMA